LVVVVNTRCNRVRFRLALKLILKLLLSIDILTYCGIPMRLESWAVKTRERDGGDFAGVTVGKTGGRRVRVDSHYGPEKVRVTLVH